MHLAIANAYTMLPNGEVNYEVDSYVMWWMGSHFDIVDVLPTKNAQAIAGVQIHHMHYVLVANHMDNTGKFLDFCHVFCLDVQLITLIMQLCRECGCGLSGFQAKCKQG